MYSVATPVLLKTIVQRVGEREATEMQVQVVKVSEVGMRAGAVMETRATKLTEVGARLWEAMEVAAVMVMEMWQGTESMAT